MTLSRDPRRLADQLRTKAAKCVSYTGIRDEYTHIADVLDKSKGTDMSESDDLIKALEGSCNCNIDTSPCMAEEDCRLLLQAANRIRALESENTYLRKIADMAAKQRDEALEALEVADANSTDKASAWDVIAEKNREIEGLRSRLATAEADALEKAAQEVDCTCARRDLVLQTINENGRMRWENCGNEPCCALSARAIRSLKPKAKA
jgi:hypothetical protein